MTGQTMQAAVMREPDQPFSFEEVTLKDLRPDEVLVRIVASGMCHTDMLPRVPELGFSLGPVILGHEGSGVVEKTGAAVTTVKPGDHVLLSYASCGECPSCLHGMPAYCAEFSLRNTTGRNADGTAGATSMSGETIGNRWFGQSSFAEYSVTTERNIVPVAEDLPLEVLAPLGCGLQTGAGAVLNVMNLRPGQSLAVFGAGAVGLSAVMAAKLCSASEIVVVDIAPSRLEIAKELGATRVVVGNQDRLVDEIRGAGHGMDFSLETTAVSSVLSASIAVLARQGTAVLVGAGSGQLTVNPAQLAGKHVTYVLEGSAVPRTFLPKLIQFWREGRFPFDKLIKTYPFAEINRASTDSLSGHTIKPVIIFE